MASSSLLYFCNLSSASLQRRRKVLKYPKFRSQSFKDEGRSADIVDANLCILRDRIEEVKRKEMRLNTSCALKHGWNYPTTYVQKHKRANMLYDSFELVGFASVALAVVFLSGSLGICLVSLLLHLSQVN